MSFLSSIVQALHITAQLVTDLKRLGAIRGKTNHGESRVFLGQQKVAFGHECDNHTTLSRNHRAFDWNNLSSFSKHEARRQSG
jgi:hypothetical protein